MRVVVISDTHVPDFAAALPSAMLCAFEGADVILHAGDVTSPGVLDELSRFAPVHVALGNNDGDGVRRWGATEQVRLELEGVRIRMLHDAGPREGREGRMRRLFPDANVVVFGHSHIPIDATAPDGLRLFNPGSPTWKRRQPLPTYGVLSVADGRVLGTAIVELPAHPRDTGRARSGAGRGQGRTRRQRAVAGPWSELTRPKREAPGPARGVAYNPGGTGKPT
jgi:putative phosphoesterase